MKNQLLKKTNFFVLIFVSYILLSLASCKKDEDTTPPEISIISPSLNDTVRNTVEIKFDAKDNEGISYVELYANDSLMGKITQPTSSFTWNTLTLKDGNYNIKCKVYDKSGNYKEEARAVTVENALIKLDIGELYGAVYNILITDSAGNVLAKSTFKTGDKFSIYANEAYYKKSINIIHFLSINNSTSTWVDLNVKRGFTLDTGNKYVPSTNTIKVHLKKNDNSFSQVIFSTDNGVRTLYSFADTLTPTQLNCTANSKLLVQVKRAESNFYKFFDITNKTDIWVDLNDVDLVQANKVITLPSGFTGSCLLTGRVKTTDLVNRYYLSNSESNFGESQVVVNYPPSGFEQITSFIGGVKNGMYYDNTIKGPIPETFVPLNVSVDVINSTVSDFKMNLNGEGDTYTLSYRNNNNTLFLNILSPTNISQFKLPDLASIYQDADLNFSTLTLKELSITKVNDIPQDRYLNSYIFREGYLIPWKNIQRLTIIF